MEDNGIQTPPVTPPKPYSDKEMLDWLDKNARHYGNGWVCRDSSCGRGLRLHETRHSEAKPTVREAIVDAMNLDLSNRKDG